MNYKMNGNKKKTREGGGGLLLCPRIQKIYHHKFCSFFFAHFSHFNFYFISPVSHRPLDSVALTGERYVVHDMYKVSCTLCGDLVV